MVIKKFASIIMILTLFYLLTPFFHTKTGKFLPPIGKMDTPDYIPGVVIVNVTEDTWIGNGVFPGGCQSDPCDNGEKFCEKNCTFVHRGCYDAGGNYGTYIDLGKGSGTSTSGTCGVYDTEKHAYLWFNLSDARTANGNYLNMSWYLIKNATIKLWAATVANCQNITLRNVLPDDNKNTVNETVHNLVYNSHYYSSGDYYTENSTFFGSQVQVTCPTSNTTTEVNITDYVINQTRYGNDIFVQLKAASSFIPGGWSVSFSSKEHTNETQRPYLQINLNSVVCGDGYCTPLNETVLNCPQDCAPMNYIEVNGTTFSQPEVINITGWSSNSSSYIYLWNNYTGTIQSMPPNGIGQQTNITDSSNLNTSFYNVYCNSTWNSTLASKSFTIVTTTTVTTTTPTTAPGGGGGGGGGSVKNITKTSTTTTMITTIETTTSTIITSTVQTTTTILKKTPLKLFDKKTPIWIFVLTIVVLVVIIAVFYIIRKRQKYTVVEIKLDDFGYDYG